MAYEDPQLLHKDAILTQISVDYQRTYRGIGPLFAPTVRVSKQSDKYNVFNADNSARVTDDVRAPKAPANELPAAMTARSESPYFAESHALKDYVPVEEQRNVDDGEGFDPINDSNTRLIDTILLNRDYTVAQMALTTANYASGHTVSLTGTARWDAPTTSDPIADIRTGRRQVRNALGRPINRVFMGRKVVDAFEDHPKFLDRLASTSLQMTDDEIVARILRIPTFETIDDEYNTSPYGTPAVFTQLWGNHVFLGYVPDNPAPRTPAFMYEFLWAGLDTPAGEGGVQVSRWFDQDRKSDALQVDRYYDHRFIAVNGTGLSIAGYLIKDAVS